MLCPEHQHRSCRGRQGQASLDRGYLGRQRIVAGEVDAQRAVGEFLIEGSHLSRDYLDETATRRTEAGFLKTIPPWMVEMHPGSSRSRSTTGMYRSGDLGQLNHDGTLTYFGRKVTILKLDGCRIDALKVEHQARKCLSDKDAVVVDLLGIINGEDEPSPDGLLLPRCTPRQ